LTVRGDIEIQAGRNAFIGTVDNYSLSLRTNNTDRVFITNTGRVGIGTTNPEALLHVNDIIISSGLRWGRSLITLDQGGAIELGNSLASDTKPYIDFHYGVGTEEDFNVRIHNDANGRLSLIASVTRMSGWVGIGTVAPLARLHVAGHIRVDGSFNVKVDVVTGNISLNGNHFLILANASANSITITLPNAGATVNVGRLYIIKKIDNSLNTVTIQPQPGQTIDGQANRVLTMQNEVVRLVAANSNWYVI
jgi:hypothetical protein